MPQRRFGKEFEAEAVRLVETSGRTQREIAEDLGIGLSTLRRWPDRRRERDLEAPPSRAPGGHGGRAEAAAARERDSSPGARDPEESRGFFSPRREVDEVPSHRCGKEGFPVQRLCKVLGVSPSGYFAWRERPACHRQRHDMVLLAHVRPAFAISNETYGSPRMVHELRDGGLAIGRRRVARLMRENGMKARQTRRFKRTTDSLHAFPVAPNLLDQDFTASGPNQKWGADISYVWTREGWLYLAVVIDLLARRVRRVRPRGQASAGPPATACTRNWPCRRCAGPSPCGVRPPGSFVMRIAAANTAASTIRPNCVDTASGTRCRARETASTTPWSRRISRR